MPSSITTDQAKARAPIAAMAALVDLRDWDGLARCLADRLTVDYSSLWGGDPQQLGRDELIAQWRGLIPGFDATRHELGPISVEVGGNEARAEAPVSATHLLGDGAWIVEGRYRCRVAREGETWRISAITYVNERESGDRGLTERAKDRASRMKD